MELLEWWNLIFILPFLVAVLYLLLLAVGTVAPEHGVEADHDHDLDHGLDHGADHGHVDHPGTEHDAGLAGKALSFLGLGRIPLSIILMSFCFVWGFFGWASNQMFRALLRAPEVYVLPSLVVALASSVLFTRFLALGLSRVMPATETYGVAKHDLVGKTAEVRYAVTAELGRAWLYDEHGVLHEVPCRVNPGDPPIPAGRRIVLFDYDEEKEVFIVCPDPVQEAEIDRASRS